MSNDEEAPSEGLDEPLLSSPPEEDDDADARIGVSEEDASPGFLEGIEIYLAVLVFFAVLIPLYCWGTSRQLDQATVEYKLVKGLNSSISEYRRDVTVPCQHGLLIFQVVPASLSSGYAFETADFSFHYQEGGPCWLFPEWHDESQTTSKLFVPGQDDRDNFLWAPSTNQCAQISTVGQNGEDVAAAMCGHYAIAAPGNWANSMVESKDTSLLEWINERVHQWSFNGTVGAWCEMSL